MEVNLEASRCGDIGRCSINQGFLDAGVVLGGDGSRFGGQSAWERWTMFDHPLIFFFWVLGCRGFSLSVDHNGL